METEIEIPNGFKQSEIGVVPEHWKVVSIGRLFDVQQGKAVSPETRRGLSPNPFLRTSNVLWGKIDLTHVDTMDFSKDEVDYYALREGDLLVCEGGEVGRSAVWHGGVEMCCYQNHIHRLRPITQDVDPEFYMYWMQSAILLLGQYRGAGNKTTIPNLSKNRLKQLPVPKPPIKEQRAVVFVLKAAQTLSEALESRRRANEDLFRTLLRNLTTGTLTPSQAEA